MGKRICQHFFPEICIFLKWAFRAALQGGYGATTGCPEDTFVSLPQYIGGPGKIQRKRKSLIFRKMASKGGNADGIVL